MSPTSRVVVVSANYHPRTCGVGDHSMRLAEALADAGIEATVLTRAPLEPHPDGPSVEAVGLPADVGADPVAPMLAWLERRRPSLVVLQYTPFAFDAGRFGGTAPLRLARGLRRRGISVLVLAHELFVPWSPRPDRALAALVQRLLFHALARSSTRVAVTTENRRTVASRWMRGRPSRTPELVPVGTNAALAPRRPGEGFRIGAFSTLSHGKRLDVVLDAFARVATHDPSATLTLLGDLAAGEAGRAFQAIVAAHPAASRITLPGKLSLGELGRRLAGLDAFTFPMDTGANTRSSTLAAALGTGLPVVAIRGLETDARFVDRENVVFATGLDGDRFASALEALRADPGLAARVGAGGRALFLDRLAWPRIAAAVLGRST